MRETATTVTHDIKRHARYFKIKVISIAGGGFLLHMDPTAVSKNILK